MACSITITSVIEDPNTGNVIVQGTASGCVGGTVDVTVSCGAAVFTDTVDYNAAGFWEASIPTNCACNQPILVVAKCHGNPSCSDTYSSNNLCCCPQFTTTLTPGPCTAALNPQQSFTFDGTIILNDSCTYQVQRHFGDGNLGQVQTFGPGPGPFQLTQETHPYNPGPYTSTMNTLTPAGCGSQAPVSFTAYCPGPVVPSAPLCQSCNFVSLLCKALEPLFLLALVIGVTLLILTPSAC